MKISIERPEKELEMKFTGTAKELMKKLEIVSEGVLIIRNGEVIPEDTKLEDSDEIKFLSVVSGG